MSDSPLGCAEKVAAVRDAYPALAPLINDLEELVSPEYKRADAEALETQKKLDRSRRLALLGTAIAAVASVLQVIDHRGFRIGASIAVVVAGAVAAAAVTGRRARDFDRWTEQRRIAEELRSLYFRELATAPPDHDSETRKLSLISQIGVVVDGGTTDVARPALVTPGDDLDDARVAVYGKHRLDDQISWMRKKVTTLRASSSRLDGAQTGLIVAVPLLGGIGLAAELSSGGITIELPQAAIASAIVAGAATAVGAAAASLGHDRLAAHYERTVMDLERYRRVWTSGMTTDGIVHAIEQALLREHRAWHQLTEDIERASS